jgi:hypothetical protein
MLGKPEPQLDSSGTPINKPMNATAAIVTAAKPATSPACCLFFRLPTWPANNFKWAPCDQNSKVATADRGSNLWTIFQIRSWVNGAIPLKRFFRNGTSRIDGEFSYLTPAAPFSMAAIRGDLNEPVFAFGQFGWPAIAKFAEVC